MRQIEKVNQLVDSLIIEGEEILKTEWTNKKYRKPIHFVALQKYHKWIGGFRILLSLLDDFADPWKDILERCKDSNTLVDAKSILGSLEAIKEGIDKGLLVRFEDLVFAEVFVDLMDQAEYLFDQGYILASGVISRAVLEERLKKLCDHNNCQPTKPRPTINDYNTILYKTKVYDKIMFKNVDSMAAIGNDAAHTNPDLRKEDVERLLRDLNSFLQRFSV
jgi:hypothetical protein